MDSSNASSSDNDKKEKQEHQQISITESVIFDQRSLNSSEKKDTDAYLDLISQKLSQSGVSYGGGASHLMGSGLNAETKRDIVSDGANSEGEEKKSMDQVGYFSLIGIPLVRRLNTKKKYRIVFYMADWLLCILVGLLAMMLFKFIPVRGRLFRLDDPAISYPLVPELVPFTHLIIYALILPIIVISVVNLIFTRNLSDFHHGVLGLFQAVVIALFITSIFKSFIGGLRPNFLEVCNPSPESIARVKPVGYAGMYYTPDICTSEQAVKMDSMSAYPSGHSSLAAAGMVYLALYLHAKIKTFNNRGHLFLVIIVLICIISFLLVGVSRIVDYRHTPGNVFSGWIIGIAVALGMYKLNYQSVFGPDNHIPILNNHSYSQ